MAQWCGEEAHCLLTHKRAMEESSSGAMEQWSSAVVTITAITAITAIVKKN